MCSNGGIILLAQSVETASGKERPESLQGADESLLRAQGRTDPSEKEFAVQLIASHILH